MPNREFILIDDAQPPFFAGIDLGGTNIKAGLVDDLGRPLSYVTVKSEIEQGPEEGARRMAEAALQTGRDAGVAANDIAYIGLATPGTMDIPHGILLNPVNLPGWHDFPIRDRVSQHAGRPVAYANDANAAAYGEFWVGSGSQYPSMILLTLGTGVGGGIIVGDQTIDGVNSHGSECGHIIVDSRDDARMCSCGHRGHLEAYASATGVTRRAQEALDAGRESSLLEVRSSNIPLTAKQIHAAAEQGDVLALEVILETGRYLGIGITTLLHTIDPAAVVLGGAMDFGGRDNPVGRQFLDRIKEEVARRAFPVIAERIEIDFASLGGDAGYIGAAGVARLRSIEHGVSS
ncbi:MAG: ROK family protein [Pirellulales bacterium]